jgi:urease accessory protein
LDLDPTAGVWLRETIVLGRFDEVGGRLRNQMAIAVDGRPVLLEDQILDPSGIRRSPGMLGSHRVIDTVLEVGTEEAGTPPAAAIRFGLVGGVGTITRYLGEDVAASPLQPV